jgi:hypothetical protein
MTSPRASALLAALSSEPASTSALYQCLGYAALTRLGLVSYHAFREELVRLAAAGLVVSDTAANGSTTWRLATPDDGEPAPLGA